MDTVAVTIVCKTPMPGRSKTRLSPPLRPEECAAISACFIRDLTTTIAELAAERDDVSACALYTPEGSETELQRLLPGAFDFVLQCDGDFGRRLLQGTTDLLDAGYKGAILINSDSPTLPKAILSEAVNAVLRGDNVTLSPAFDGGYTLIGLSRPHARLFADIPWSTSEVYRLTLERARELGLPVINVPGWYDVDDAQSFAMLEAELAGKPPAFAALAGSEAPATRQFLRERTTALSLSL